MASIEAALDAIRGGGMVIVADDEDRENEGDLIMAAEHVTAAKMGFFIGRTSGFICAALPSDVCDRLDLPLMHPCTTSDVAAYAVTVDAAQGVVSGISATDRARTARLLADPSAAPGDLRRPGHVVPLRARRGGVLERRGHTEAAVDLARLAGCRPAGVLSELVDEDGELQRGSDLEMFGKTHQLPLITVEDIVAYRLRTGR